MELLRIRLAQAHTTALSLGRSTEFRTDKPWDSVWHAAVEDDKFWKRKLERPAGKLTNYLAGIEGDAPVWGSGASSHNTRQPPQQQQQFQQQKQPKPNASPSNWKTHDTSTPPMELCRGYQTGACKIGQGKNLCGRNPTLCHRCAVCLSDRHGAKLCGGPAGYEKSGGSKQKHHKREKGNKKKGNW